MDIRKMKWISALIAAIFIGAFEFIRHQFLHVISMEWGNVLVAVVTGVLVFLYFHGISAMIENLYGKLQKEKEETAVLQERYRIAREIHDSVAQALFFMNIKMVEIETALRQRQEPWVAIGEVKEAIRMTDTDIRQHIFVLQKVPQEKINLPEVVRQYIADFQKDSGIKVDLSVAENVGDSLSLQVKNKLFRILQELLQNIRKHAGARHVNVSLQREDCQLFMIVGDDGQGLPIDIIKKQGLSFGLKLLEDDVRDIGGRLKLESSPGQGTTATIRLDVKGKKLYEH
ncbi:sensor histidine kinase [Sporomusa sp. KB1]|jgi:signal transduction histidine kinase|uniref:sensor histidine kinase n=1 Tax=Sporomusa sp. KB1 TaxID=943346 RepID=UPI00119EDD1B|nr:ATP-binding protein [Sporomusa sp. KB1]TWH47615.1 two-component system nitrate/nitrite sensor histidine kinase NarX [Sporomusa sp. KB1]